MNNDYLVEATSHIKQLPISIYAPNQKKLRSTLSEKVIPNYESFEYELNEYGFRYKEPKTANVLLTSGCSITFGQGLSQEKIYPEIVSKQLGLECVNVALPGTGPEIQIANAYWALQKYKPKTFLFYMSDLERRPYATESSYETINNHWGNNFFSSKSEKQIWILHNQKNEWTRYLQIAWSMYPIIEFCKIHNTTLLWKCWIGKADSILRTFDWLQNTGDMGNMKEIDKARDNMHHGVLSHDEFANRILNAIKV